MPASGEDAFFLNMNEILYFSIAWRYAGFETSFVSFTRFPKCRTTFSMHSGGWKFERHT